MTDAYEAMVYSYNLPNRAVGFIYRDGDPKLAGGIFRIERVRTATDADEKEFRLPPDERCPLCGQDEK